MMNNDLFIEAYKEARQATEKLLGTTPETTGVVDG